MLLRENMDHLDFFAWGGGAAETSMTGWCFFAAGDGAELTGAIMDKGLL